MAIDIPKPTPVAMFPVKGKYDANEFLTASSDTKGHWEKLWLKVPPALARELGTILQAKRFPYESISDILRHGLIRHLKYLISLEPDIHSMMSHIETMNVIMRDEMQNQQFKDLFENIEKMIDGYDRSDRGQAVKKLLQIKEQIDQISDMHWRDKYAKEFERRWGKWYMVGTDLAQVAITETDKEVHNGEGTEVADAE